MIKHIVMWKLKGEGAEKHKNVAAVKAGLKPVKVSSMGCDQSPWDMAVYSEFAERATMDAYQCHPKHLAIKPIIGPLREGRGALEYES